MNLDTQATWTWDIPEYFNIGVACTDRHLGTKTARATAMIVEDVNRGTDTVSFAELAHFTDRFAQLLRKLGVDAGERVLIRLPNSLTYPIAFLGAMKRGAISVPTSTMLVAEEVSYLATDSGAAVLVIDKSMWDSLADRLEGVNQLRHVILAGPGPMPGHRGHLSLHDMEASMAAIVDIEPAHETRAGDPAYLVYTSGTTGRPKGVLHGHRALLGRQPASEYWFDFAETDRILHSGKFNWTYVLGTGLMDPLYRGKTVVVYEGPNTPLPWPELIRKHQCTIFIGVPTIYRQIIQKTRYGARDLPSLRYCMSAGEHLSDEMLESWRERFGIDIYEALGMSELSYYISHNKGAPLRPGSAGRPQPGHDVRLLDPATLQEIPDGEEGMMCVLDHDPGLFIEYWNLPDETRQVRHDGWFFTGDYARKDEDGYIWFLGRRDDIINSFGFRISPHEVERVIKTHPDIADCVVVGQEAGPGKTLVAACVVLRPGAGISTADLLAFTESRLAAYKRPKLIHVMQDYPRTKNGKVIRRKLQAMLADSQQSP